MVLYQARIFQIQVKRLTQFLAGMRDFLHTAEYKKTSFVMMDLEPSFAEPVIVSYSRNIVKQLCGFITSGLEYKN